ncbi:MAG: hypothetical protein ACR5LF_16155 [Symbiopectobacterium sp.]
MFREAIAEGIITQNLAVVTSNHRVEMSNHRVEIQRERITLDNWKDIRKAADTLPHGLAPALTWLY